MNLKQVADLMDRVFRDEIQKLRAEGQAEYALGANAFGNFERAAASLKMTREQVLIVYLLKHIDGITSYANGHKSQREDVRGRINDAIVYLFLLRAMVEDEKSKRVDEEPPNATPIAVIH